MKKIVGIFILLLPFSIRAQESKSTDSIYTVKNVDSIPQFPGGQSGLMHYLTSNLRYPIEATEAGIQGRVISQFVIYEDGSLHDIQIIDGPRFGCDEEVIRLIKAMPKWTPGLENNHPVKVYFIMPVTFTMGGDDRVYAKLNSDAAFNGGENHFIRYLRKNVKYPEDAKAQNIRGSVEIKFTVMKDGSIQNAIVTKSLYPSCDDEALRVINAMPKWLPADHNNKPIEQDVVWKISFPQE